MRYGVVGAASNLIIYFLYLLITDHSVEPKTVMTLVYITGVSISFFVKKIHCL